MRIVRRGTHRHPSGLVGLLILIILAVLCSGCAGLTALASVQGNELNRIAPHALGSLKTIGEYTVLGRQVTFVSENGVTPVIPPPVLMKEMEAYDTHSGQAVTAQDDSLFEANPLEATIGRKKQQREYVVFSSNQAVFDSLKKHEADKVTASGWAVTITSDAEALVTLVRVPGAGEVQPESATGAAETEMCQLTLNLSATQATFARYTAMQAKYGLKFAPQDVQAKLDSDAQELYCSSMGWATAKAQAGAPYEAYQSQAAARKFLISDYWLPAIVFDRPIYDALAAAR